jgi:hypothetical protein
VNELTPTRLSSELKCLLWTVESVYEGVSKSFRTGWLEWELQMIELSATRCSCTAILWVSLMSFDAITLCVASERVFIISVYFIIDSVRKLLDTSSYNGFPMDLNVFHCRQLSASQRHFLLIEDTAQCISHAFMIKIKDLKFIFSRPTDSAVHTSGLSSFVYLYISFFCVAQSV